MKLNPPFRVLIIVFCFLQISQVFSQKYSLYRSHTLGDCVENPYEWMFDPAGGKKVAINFMTFNFSQSMYGPQSRNLSHFIAHEKMSFDKKDYPVSDKMNYIKNDFMFDIFVMRFRLSKLTKMEFTYAVQVKGENQFSFTDNLVNALIIGTGPYKGDSLKGIFNGTNYTSSYLKISYGLRRNINE